ncbi:wolframin [Episyrphus balteatus]|uniref:wolframin n=1 Tax=Episyrphus balteatus TaxID=286459 RepID=UPI002485DD49|nr:wolframin [Episyrphus balteatus]
MANWTKKPPAGSSNRRKWNLEDRTSLNNLKYHFAADGCSDVQYDLARQLLDSNIEHNEASSHVQGVHWLLCAAQQGHEDALRLLQECFDNRRGISDANIDDVRSCLGMTTGERAARKAARDLFACLSNGGEHITPKQLERKMREIYKLQKRRKRHNDSTSEEEDETEQLEDVNHVNGDIYPCEGVDLNVSHPERVITEANLVNAAVNYANGRLPAVNDELTLSIPHPNSLDHVPCFHRIIFHPIVFCRLLYHRLINLIASFPGSLSPSMKLALIFLVYIVVSSDNLTVYLPISFYYLCLGAMVWSTCKMLKSKHDFIDFRIWSGLFLSYGDNNVEAGISENRFLKNNMKPYLYFFCAFVGNLIVCPLISTEWLPHSEITILSFLMVFISMVAFMYTSSQRRFPDILVLFSFGINVLAKYPYEMDEVVSTGWRFLDLKVPTFSSFVIGNGIEFCLNCRTVLYLMIPLFLVHLAKRSNWHGTYTYLIPHCVTLSWLQLCITSSQSATMFGVVRAALGLAGILLFLPLFGIVSLMVPVFLAVEYVGLTDPRMRLVTTIVAAAFALLGSCCMAVNQNTQKYITFLQIAVSIVAAAILTLPYMTSSFKAVHTETSLYSNLIHDKPIITSEEDTQRHISWEKFYHLCGQPAWEHSNKIKTQLRCSYLTGSTVSWDGTITEVQIARVMNFRAELIRDYLPAWLANIVECVYGESNRLECSDGDVLCEELRKTTKLQQRCNLNRWNVYEYEMLLRMNSGLLSKPIDVKVHADDRFRNFTTLLRSGDRIHIYGKLMNTRKSANTAREDFVLGSGKPSVQLTGIECTVCTEKDMPALNFNKMTSAVDARMRDLTRGIKYLLNVLLNPLITFK